MDFATADLGSDSDIEPSNDIELAGSASVDLEPANVTSSRQRSLLDVLKPASKSRVEKLKIMKREGLQQPTPEKNTAFKSVIMLLIMLKINYGQPLAGKG